MFPLIILNNSIGIYLGFFFVYRKKSEGELDKIERKGENNENV